MISNVVAGLVVTLAVQTPAWDRARLTLALERLIETGEPRHVDHDEGLMSAYADLVHGAHG